MPIKQLEKDVAAAGTAEPLAATGIKAAWVLVQAKTGNVGQVYLGDLNISATTRGRELDALESFLFPAMQGNEYNLADIFIDVGTNDDGVTVLYMQR